MTYDFLLWYFGANNLALAIITSFLINLEDLDAKRKRNYFHGEVECTSTYIQRRIPLSAHAISDNMKRLKDDDIIATSVRGQHRYLMLNIAKIMAIKCAYDDYIETINDKYRNWDTDYAECVNPKMAKEYKTLVAYFYKECMETYEDVYEEYCKYKEKYKR